MNKQKQNINKQRDDLVEHDNKQMNIYKNKT